VPEPEPAFSTTPAPLHSRQIRRRIGCYQVDEPPAFFIAPYADTPHDDPLPLPSFHYDLARFDALRLRQSQGQHALINASGDFARIDGWIEFVNSPETCRPYLAIDGFTREFFRMPVNENSEFRLV
jgi:hypothetical protein